MSLLKFDPSETPQEGRDSPADRGINSFPIGIIDIGSNSVRMVVYEGLLRSPQALFNEKVLCGLGRSIGKTGRIDDGAFRLALQTLKRFSILAKEMALMQMEAVATAAVRDADNGQEFVAAVERECGLKVRVISGEEEAYYSGLGVISGMPDATGVVGDLGGGSLELTEIKAGAIGRRVSLALGSLRLMNNGAPDLEKLRSHIDGIIGGVSWLKELEGQPVFMVGGSWRALARVEMHRARYPLNIVHQYSISAAAVTDICGLVQSMEKRDLKRIRGLSERRIPTLGVAALLLERLIRALKAPHAIVSALGLREGLLYEKLSPEIRMQDPFLSACHDLAERQGRYPEHGEVIMRWLDPIFTVGETEAERHIRRALCMLSDIGWRGHPDFRAERAMYESLYGWFVGIDARGRAFMGLALYICFGGSPEDRMTRVSRQLLSPEESERAVAIGRAIRLAQRFSAGMAHSLNNSRLLVENGRIVLELNAETAPLLGEVVERRLARMAAALGMKADVRIKA